MYLPTREPFVGDAIDTVGGVVSTTGPGGPLLTMTVEVEVPTVPTGSNALATRVCVPLAAEVLDQEHEIAPPAVLHMVDPST